MSEALPQVNGVVVGDIVNEQNLVTMGVKDIIITIREKAKELSPLDLVTFVPYLNTPEVLLDKIADLLQIDLTPLKDYVASMPEKFSKLDVNSIVSLLNEFEAIDG